MNPEKKPAKKEDFDTQKNIMKENEDSDINYIDKITQGVLIHEKGTIIRVNQAFLNIIGYKLTDIQDLNVDALFAILAGDETLKKNLDSGNSKPFTYQINKKNGDFIDVLVENSPNQYHKKSVKATYFTDISSIVLKDTKGNQNQRNYKELSEEISDVVWVVDVKTLRYVYVSKPVLKISGYCSKEIMMQDFYNLFSADSRTYLKHVFADRIKIFEETHESKKYIDEVEQVCKDNVKIWMEITTYLRINPHNNKIEIVGTSHNISQRKAAEKKAMNEQYHRELFIKHAPLAIIEWDKNNEIIAWNPEAENIFGYKATQVLGENFFEVLIPDIEKKDIEDVVNKLMNTKDNLNHKNLNRTKNGQLITCEWYNTPLFNAEGEFLSIISMAKNITEYEKANNEIQKANKNYQQLISELHEGVGIVNLNEEFIFVNPAFEKLIGYKADYLKGKSLLTFINPEYSSNILQETEKRKQGKSSNYTTEIITKNETVKTISISASPWRNDSGEIVGSMALIMDVTRQTQANQELSRRYNFEKRIFNISTRFADTSNFEEKVNQSLQDIGSLSHAEGVFIIRFDYKNELCIQEFNWQNPNSKKIDSMAFYPQGIFNTAINLFKSNEHFFLRNISDLKKEWEPLHTYLEKNDIANLMGFAIYVGAKLYGFLGIQNISTQNNWSKNEFVLLRSASEILCNSIQRKLNEDQFKRLNIQLNEKNKEIEQVLYVTSHDIRSPLVNIIGFTRELNKSIDELNELIGKETITPEDRENINYLINEDIPEVLRFINAGGVKIDKLLNSLLQLSRLGRTPVEFSMVNTKALVNEILASMEFQIQTQKIKVKIGELPEMLTDKKLITQILTNLIDNAIKYQDENKAGILNIDALINNDKITFTVEDNGVGIPDDKKEKVFEIFNRLNPNMAEGEGIGLTIIKKAVEQLNGKISLKSGMGVGSKFTVVLEKN